MRARGFVTAASQHFNGPMAEASSGALEFETARKAAAMLRAQPRVGDVERVVLVGFFPLGRPPEGG